MTFVVPFDGSDLSKAALLRAMQFDRAFREGVSRGLEEDVVAIAVIPQSNADYARTRGWLGPGEPFDLDQIVQHLREMVNEIAPEATFEYTTTDRYAPMGTIGTQVRKLARKHDASIVFVGSDNAGRIVSSITVGQRVAADRSYETLIVPLMSPAPVKALEELGPRTDDLLI